MKALHRQSLKGITGIARLLPFKRPKARILKGYLNFTLPYGEFLERREPKFKLVKTNLSAGNFICRLFWPISSDFGAIRS